MFKVQRQRSRCNGATAAEQPMVGRTLSVARVRELNAKDYFYQMSR
jgi:hypothetical protein